MPLMTGGQAVTRALRAEGVEVVFGLPGVQIMHIYDAFFDTREVRLITTRPRADHRLYGGRLRPLHGQDRRRAGGAGPRALQRRGGTVDRLRHLLARHAHIRAGPTARASAGSWERSTRCTISRRPCGR